MENKDNNVCSIEGWTKDELLNLQEGKEAFGPEDIKKINEKIPTKSPEEIVMAINYYKKIGFKKSKHAKKYPVETLTEFEKFFKDNLTPEEIQASTAELSTTFRMIGNQQESDTSECEIDFSKIYHTMADVIEGKPIAPDDVTAAILQHCLHETALAAEAIVKTGNFDELEPNEELLATLKSFTNQRKDNPSCSKNKD